MDKAYVFPFRFMLIILFLVTTFFNNDHPIRCIGINKPKKTELKEHFQRWYDHLKTEIDSDTLSRGKPNDSIPVVFIAAEGGASRTGAFTAMYLAALQDSFPEFSKHIYCYSTVSGGTLGANYFNAVSMNQRMHPDTLLTYKSSVNKFFRQDFLSAVMGKLLFGEIINYFIPRNIQKLDRAVALEQGWEEGWSAVYGNESNNILANSFDSTETEGSPAIFINTTEAETGLQCIWSNVDVTGLPLGSLRDLYSRTRNELRYSSAIGISTRFPLISPAAAFFYRPEGRDSSIVRRHFVDGGYFENKGAETLLQVLKELPIQNLPIKPYIIQFNFSQEDSSFKSITKFNEVMEIVGAAYNTRSGRAALGQYYLKQYVHDVLNGQFIDLSLTLTQEKFPMNWVLSYSAMNRLDEYITRHVGLGKDSFAKEDQGELRKLDFLYNQK